MTHHIVRRRHDFHAIPGEVSVRKVWTKEESLPWPELHMVQEENVEKADVKRELLVNPKD